MSSLCIILQLLLYSCSEWPKTETNTPKKEIIMTQKIDSTSILAQWLNLRQVNPKELLSINSAKVENVSYEGLSNLTRIQAPNDYTAYYFFDKEEQFVMLYIGDEDYLTQLSLEEIIEGYGQPETTLRSRAGKAAHHYVYPQHGFAFSEENGALVLFEVFPNCTLTAYKEKIYREPPAFRK